MAAEARIVAFENKRHWSNWHLTIEREPILGRYEVHNPETNPGWVGMRKTAAVLQRFIAETNAAGQRLHPIGARWSHSSCASPSGGRLLATETANWTLRPDRASLAPDFRGEAEELVLVQCGVQISELNKRLEQGWGRSLSTSGLNNGQTIAGAISTSSHGSAIDQGALQAQVCGLQLLTADRNLWLERDGDPIAGPGLLQKLGASRLRGDDLFEAALVSLGGLGLIHSVMLRTAPLFHLIAYQEKLPYDDALRRAMDESDFSGLRLPQGTERPYYFRVILNPHDRRNLAYVNVMYKRPFPPGTPIDYSIDGEFGPGRDVPRLVGELLDNFPGLTRGISSVIVDNQLKLYADERGTWGEMFGYSDPREKGAAASMGIAQNLTSRAVELAQKAYREAGPAPVVITCRFIGRTPGLLAWQQHERNCIIEVDGLRTERARKVMEAVRAEFDRAGLAYGEHWGKLHGLTRAKVERAYGSKLDRWRAARETFLPMRRDRQTFSNEFLENIGLGA
ncbi:MAG TPA: FAD-binding protein [Allosphingosinicella sp.]|nr:FAD-binding protein [Allosphingosinicella sp.]